MKKYNNPGIFFEEVVASKDGATTVVRKPATINAGAVTGAEMGIGAFVGTAPRGAVRKPVLVTNWTEYVNEFGAFDNNSMLAYAVQGFFLNGGDKAYIVRTTKFNSDVNTAKIASLAIKDDAETEFLTISAKNEGAWGNDLSVEVANVGEGKFTLNVYYKNVLAESYVATLADIEIDVQDSKLIDLIAGTGTPKAVSVTSLTGGNDGLAGIEDADYVNALEALVDVEFNNLAVPNVTSKTVHKAMDDFCDRVGRGKAIKDAPNNLSTGELSTYRESLGNSARGVMVYPYVVVNDPIGLGKNPTKEVPASGFVMGRIAQMQRDKGVWNATAGIDAKIAGIVGLAKKVSDSDIAVLNPQGITCLKELKNVGAVIWGARTFSSDSTFKYAVIRDLADYIELSLSQSMTWTNFKGNDERLWGMIKPNVESFLRSLWSQGGLKGEKEAEAFWVKCDAELNTPEVVDAGITYCEIGFAGVKPNEFTVFKMNINA